MLKDQIKQAALIALSRLMREDGSLFDCEVEEEFEYDSRKLHEVCINHKLAIYLGNEILPIISSPDHKYFVDIEFNREGINKKKMITNNGKELVVRPDIIIHNRKSGNQKENFLIVECKKQAVSDSAIDYDRKKIRAFMEDDKYKYVFGLQVVYGKAEIKGIFFYNDGQAIVQEKTISS